MQADMDQEKCRRQDEHGEDQAKQDDRDRYLLPLAPPTSAGRDRGCAGDSGLYRK
jgi:hypothetical protein